MKKVTDVLSSDFHITNPPLGKNFECPFCHRKTFQIKADDSVGKCFHPSCEHSITTKNNGRQSSLSKPCETPIFNVEAAQRRLYDDAIAMAYLHGRALADDTINHFGLGLDVDKKSDRWISIPHFEDGKLVNVKFRRLTGDGDRFRRIMGCKSILFHGDIVKDNPDTILIAEGEFCAISCWQSGIKNVVSSTTGCADFKKEWIIQLNDISKIYIAYDNDDAGRISAKKLASRLGTSRCLIVSYPDGINDANEALQKGINLTDLLSSAKPPEIKNSNCESITLRPNGYEESRKIFDEFMAQVEAAE